MEVALLFVFFLLRLRLREKALRSAALVTEDERSGRMVLWISNLPPTLGMGPSGHLLLTSASPITAPEIMVG